MDLINWFPPNEDLPMIQSKSTIGTQSTESYQMWTYQWCNPNLSLGLNQQNLTKCGLTNDVMEFISWWLKWIVLMELCVSSNDVTLSMGNTTFKRCLRLTYGLVWFDSIRVTITPSLMGWHPITISLFIDTNCVSSSDWIYSPNHTTNSEETNPKWPN